MVITRIGPLSVAKVAAVLYAGIGLIIGAFVSLAAMAGAMFIPREEGGMFGAIFGVAAIIVVPLFYAVLGFIGTFIAAALFNVAVGITGGVEVDVK